MITRFLEPTELELLQSIFKIDNRFSFNEKLSSEDLDEWCRNLILGIDRGFKKCAITLSDSGDLICLVVGTEYSNDLGWFLGLVKIIRKKEINNNYAIIGKTIDHMIAHMESRGIYKFWEHKELPERKYLTGRRILTRHSALLPRYNRITDASERMTNKNNKETVIWRSTLKPEFIPGADGGD